MALMCVYSPNAEEAFYVRATTHKQWTFSYYCPSPETLFFAILSKNYLYAFEIFVAGTYKPSLKQKK